MELRVLEYFLAVAREQSISGAAEYLHLTQPTLSRQLRELEEELAARHAALGAEHGFAAQISGYPGWPADRDNPLASLLERVWREQTGRTLELTAVHVGLEPSVLRAKAPGLVMASTGPDILDAHSVDERAPLAGLADYALLLAGAMEAL